MSNRSLCWGFNLGWDLSLGDWSPSSLSIVERLDLTSCLAGESVITSLIVACRGLKSFRFTDDRDFNEHSVSHALIIEGQGFPHIPKSPSRSNRLMKCANKLTDSYRRARNPPSRSGPLPSMKLSKSIELLSRPSWSTLAMSMQLEWARSNITLGCSTSKLLREKRSGYRSDTPKHPVDPSPDFATSCLKALSTCHSTTATEVSTRT